MKFIYLSYIFLTALAFGEETVFTIRKVSLLESKPTKEPDKVITINGEKFYIDDSPLLVDADVVRAWVSNDNDNEISFEFSESAGEKLFKATSIAHKNRGRIAIFLDGALVATPAVHTELSKMITIDGLKDIDKKRLKQIVEILNKNKDEIGKIDKSKNKLIKEEDNLFLPELPNDKKLSELLKPGLSKDLVIKSFGKPFSELDTEIDGTFSIIYQVNPFEKNRNKGESFKYGFMANFENNALSSWEYLEMQKSE